MKSIKITYVNGDIEVIKGEKVGVKADEVTEGATRFYADNDTLVVKNDDWKRYHLSTGE